MELKEMIKVMQHYENGGEIETKGKNEEDTEWGLCDYPIWDWNTFKYRIKEPKQKVTIEKWLCEDIIRGVLVVIETSNIEEYPFNKKIKLIETYEVEL